MNKKVIKPEGTTVVGPYSPAIDAGDLIFFSGQIPIDSTTCKIVEGDIKVQTEQSLKNLSNLLIAAGIGFNNIVKSTVYLSDMNDFQGMNEIYSTFFEPPYPARTAIAVAALPLGSKVEIEVIAKRN